MLSIHLQGHPPRDALTFDGSYDELFATIKVVKGEQYDGSVTYAVPFLELSGQMVNLTHVETIEELAERAKVIPVPVRRPNGPLPGELECPHGFLKGTCSACGIDPP